MVTYPQQQDPMTNGVTQSLPQQPHANTIRPFFFFLQTSPLRSLAIAIATALSREMDAICLYMGWCALFLVHTDNSACFELLAVTHFSFTIKVVLS